MMRTPPAISAECEKSAPATTRGRSPSDRPRHAGAVEDRLVDAAGSYAVARRVELGDLAFERAVEAVRRAAPGRQHDRVDGLDAPLDARINVRHDHCRAL